ncbi:hypothetical protein LCGC14_2288600 [marine sediment metagenome]|uniref:Uncharacterized protein n=1 Tax=marine sediment metagenome TaxID=412755 RepID=A0A0F9CRS0_9ZZZZ
MPFVKDSSRYETLRLDRGEKIAILVVLAIIGAFVAMCSGGCTLHLHVGGTYYRGQQEQPVLEIGDVEDTERQENVHRLDRSGSARYGPELRLGGVEPG